MGRSQRVKGACGEREAAKIFRENGYPDARRGDSQSRGAREADVEDTPFWIEVKRGKKVRLRAAIEQAKNDADYRPPIVVWRDDRSGWRVDVDLDIFLEICDGKGL
jgi:Holliday junction resolvase